MKIKADSIQDYTTSISFWHANALHSTESFLHYYATITSLNTPDTTEKDFAWLDFTNYSALKAIKVKIKIKISS